MRYVMSRKMFKELGGNYKAVLKEVNANFGLKGKVTEIVIDGTAQKIIEKDVKEYNTIRSFLNKKDERRVG